MTTIVRLDEVTCAYGGIPVVEDVSLEVAEGDFVGIVGPSGSGKTTLLKTIAGAVRPVAGRVQLGRSLRLGYVPQVDAVDWHFPVTVMELLLMGRNTGRVVPWASKRDIAHGSAILERLDLDGLERRHIRELSGGQQQRAFIGRALLREPDLLLLDEPTSGIDMRTRHEVVHLLHDLHEEGTTVILSTHDLNGIAAHLPRIVCLNREVIAAGTPLDVITPSVLERTYGAPLEVLLHAGLPVVVEHYAAEPAHNVVRLRDDGEARHA